LTKADRAKLKALAARPDSEIDTSDIPEMTNEQWKHARRGHFYRPRKRQITARVDVDVLDWLKSQGKGYQSRINAILRREMLTSVKSIRSEISGYYAEYTILIHSFLIEPTPATIFMLYLIPK
jgi:uncharacterized protein (DUF4415 family)